MAKDYYNILGVEKGATAAEIKKAFRKKAHAHHPDKSGGDDAKFKELNEAYQILGSADKRKQYDQHGSAAFEGQGFGGTGMNWEDFMRQARGASSASGRGQAGQGFEGGNFGFDFSDIMGDIFGFGSRSRSSSRHSSVRAGEDIAIEISLEFMEAIFGVEKKIRLKHVIKCARCRGNGAEPDTKIISCANCGGTGAVRHTQSTFLGTFETQSACPACRGEGKAPEKPCHECGGGGRVEKAEDVELAIPAGISEGEHLRVEGLGNAGAHGGPNGDLLVRIYVKPHNKFKREGYDIKSAQKITIAQAVLGDSVEVATAHGAVNLKIPSGTESGKVFKLRDKGAPHLNGRGQGDHLVRVVVDIPQKLSRKQKKLFEALREEE